MNGETAVTVDAVRRLGYCESPEALIAQLRSASDVWEGVANKSMEGPAAGAVFAPALMASAYSFVLADVLQWYGSKHPDEQFVGLCGAVDDILTNGGSLIDVAPMTPQQCPDCAGNGCYVDWSPCTTCQGSGTVYDTAPHLDPRSAVLLAGTDTGTTK